MKKYLSFLRLRFSANLQYRAAAIAGLSTQFFFGLVTISVYSAFYRNGENPSFTLEQLISYVWLGQIFYSLTYICHKDKELLNIIRTGSLGYELVRPQNIYVMWYLRILAAKVSGVLLRGVPFIIVLIFLPGEYRIRLPYNVSALLFFIFSLLLATILIVSIITLMYVCVCYTLNDKGVFSMLSLVISFLSGQSIPLALFPSVISKILSYLPFAYIQDFSYRIYSGNIIGSAIYKGLIIQCIWIFIILIIGYILTDKIIKRVVVQGG